MIISILLAPTAFAAQAPSTVSAPEQLQPAPARPQLSPLHASLATLYTADEKQSTFTIGGRGIRTGDGDFWMSPPPQLSQRQGLLHTLALSSNVACLAILGGVGAGAALLTSTEGGALVWAFGSIPFIAAYPVLLAAGSFLTLPPALSLKKQGIGGLPVLGLASAALAIAGPIAFLGWWSTDDDLLFGIAAVGVVGAPILGISQSLLTKRKGTQAAAASQVRLGIVPTRGGAQLGLSLSF